MNKAVISTAYHTETADRNTEEDITLWERKICWMMQKANGAILIKVYKYMWSLILAEEGL